MLASHTAPPRPGSFEGGDALAEADTLRTVHHVLHGGSAMKVWHREGDKARVTLSLSAADEARLVRSARRAPFFGWTCADVAARAPPPGAAQIAAGWKSTSWEFFVGSSGDADVGAGIGAPVSASGVAPEGGAAPQQPLPAAQGVRITLAVPGYITRDALRAAVEGGGAKYDPLYLWTQAARDAAWATVGHQERRNLSNRFGEQMRVRAPRGALQPRLVCAYPRLLQAYYGMEVAGSDATKQKELIKAATLHAGPRKEVYNEVAAHVTHKLATQRAMDTQAVQ